MKMQSICPDIVLEDPREDYKTAVRVEQYRVSRQAIYFAAFPGTRYLPFRAVRQAWAQKAGLPLTGCCGKELQIVALRMKYKGDFYHTFTFEKQKAAEQVLALLADGCPDVVLEPERPARKVCEAADG
ncbi:hypothetical protein [Dysosmobacter sp.]|jgi:hypothetical protein|uniref:hypothetical protein n=1 Tax=Dysosmobacter sp. TaxID=2591382 RepID=UPI002A9F8B8C|nr:hypothetical protein [Dysosmobacter sp.]MCI6054556.1 hypothetical protein [Dysosmobacter sp.]MDY5510222.1 hypothetical protein [Dysosmobacter sp.]